MEESFWNLQNTNDPVNQEINPIAPPSSNNNIQDSDSQSQNPAAPVDSAVDAAHTENQVENQQLLDATNKIRSKSPVLQFEGLRYLRQALSKVNNPPIDDVINTGICQDIISLVYEKDDDKFLCEAAWLFTNILSGSSEQGFYLINLGVLPFLFTIFEKNNDEIKEQVMWAFGNIAAISAKCRDYILNHEKLNYIYDFLSEVNFHNQRLVKTMSWAASNFIRGKPHPEACKVMPLFSFLERVILEIHDVEALTDATWGCSNLTEIDGSLKIFQDELFLQKLIQQLSSSDESLQIASLRTICNLSSSIPYSYEIMFRFVFLDKIGELILNPKKNIRKECFWQLSEMCRENNDIVEVLLVMKVYEKLLKVLKEDSEDVKKVALWLIRNTAAICNVDQARRLAQIGLIREMINLVETMEASQNIVLQGLIEYFKKNKNIVGNEERNRLIGVLDRIIKKGTNSASARYLRFILLYINNNDWKINKFNQY